MFTNNRLWILCLPIALALVPTLASAAPGYPPETVYDGPKSVPAVARPGYKQSITDPVFGTKVTRISDSSMGGSPGGSWESLYSKVQAWNSDMTKIMIGSGTFIIDATTYNMIKNQGWRYEAKWSTVDPNTMFYISGNQFRKLNVQTGADVVLRTFPEGNIDMGPWEGNISVGDRYVVLTVGSLGILYDILNDGVLAKRNVGADAAGSLDWISISQSGNYIVAIGPSNSPFGARVYDRANFGNLSVPPRKIRDIGEHADLGYDTSGAEVFAQVCPMVQARLDDGVTRNLLPAHWQCGHLSTRNYSRPGWALKSGAGELYAVKLDGSGTVERFAHERSTKRNYSAEPRGSVSPDGRKVIWNSDWGDSAAPVYAYVAEMAGNPSPPSDGGTGGADGGASAEAAIRDTRGPEAADGAGGGVAADAGIRDAGGTEGVGGAGGGGGGAGGTAGSGTGGRDGSTATGGTAGGQGGPRDGSAGSPSKVGNVSGCVMAAGTGGPSRGLLIVAVLVTQALRRRRPRGEWATRT